MLPKDLNLSIVNQRFLALNPKPQHKMEQTMKHTVAQSLMLMALTLTALNIHAETINNPEGGLTRPEPYETCEYAVLNVYDTAPNASCEQLSHEGETLKYNYIVELKTGGTASGTVIVKEVQDKFRAVELMKK